MNLDTHTVHFGHDRQFQGYLAVASRAARPLPAVVVLQEAWGVDAHIEDLTRRFALAGYVALAPDVYAVGGNRPAALGGERLAELKEFYNSLGPAMMDPSRRDAHLATLPEDARARVQASMAAMMSRIQDSAANLAPVTAAVAYLETVCEDTRGQKVAAVGYCMGGGLAARLAATHPPLAGAVVYYGMAPPTEMIPGIRCPILGFYGGTDDRVTGGVGDFARVMAAQGGHYESVVYSGVGHAFFNDTRPSYDVVAARDAYAKTLNFLRTVLG